MLPQSIDRRVVNQPIGLQLDKSKVETLDKTDKIAFLISFLHIKEVEQPPNRRLLTWVDQSSERIVANEALLAFS